MKYTHANPLVGRKVRKHLKAAAEHLARTESDLARTHDRGFHLAAAEIIAAKELDPYLSYDEIGELIDGRRGHAIQSLVEWHMSGDESDLMSWTANRSEAMRQEQQRERES